MTNYKLYIIKIDYDDFTDEMEVGTLEHAKEIIETLQRSKLETPNKIELIGYKNNIETLIKVY